MSAKAVDVEVRAATEEGRALIRNLYPLYLHDLTAFTDLYDVDARGVFFPDYLSEWLDRPSPVMHPLVFHEGGRPAGFALVGEAPYPHMTPGRDFRMGEFFVLNRARRRGVGRRAALEIFTRFPGVWEVTELARNTAAVAFWKAVIGQHTGGVFSNGIEHGEWLQVFDSRCAGPGPVG